MESSRRRPPLLGRQRRLFQRGTTLALLGVPFVRIGGESLLRLDLPTWTLFLGGSPFGLEDLHLLLLAAVSLVLFFLLVTLALGRAWCGWGCPQTTLTDLVDWFARRLGGKIREGVREIKGWRKGALHAFCAALALLVAVNLVLYFLSPYDFFPRLAEGELPGGALWGIALVAGPLYLDLAFVGRLMCREFCPYGRLQAALADPGTLTLRFDPGEGGRCLRCEKCVRACPTGIDIRRGEQIECINCGRCLDACRLAMAPRGERGLIRYSFGVQGKGVRALLNGRILFLSTAFLASCLLLVWVVAGSPSATLKVGRPAAAPARMLADGRTVNLFTAFVGNRERRPVTASLVARDPRGGALEVLGPTVGIVLPPGERRRLDFTVVLPAGAPAGKVRLLLVDARGNLLAEAEAQLLSAPPQK